MQADTNTIDTTTFKEEITNLEQAKKTFSEALNVASLDATVISPGRINIIGEHTDYNGGLSLPSSISKGIYFGFKKLPEAQEGDPEIHLDLTSYQFKSQLKITKLEKREAKEESWANYLIGVASKLKEDYGLDSIRLRCIFGGNLPMGYGVSSSAALCCGFAAGVAALYGLELEKLTLAKIAQYSEINFAGVNCGLLDQTAIFFGSKNTAVRIDFKDNSLQKIDFSESNFSVILADSGEKRELAGSEYNKRRATCEAALEKLKAKFGEENDNFRDYTLEEINQAKEDGILTELEHRRASFVGEESKRVDSMVEALKENNEEKMGELLNGSHTGLSELYEVTTERLDQLVELANAAEGCIGSRMMGGGFGGCTVNLVRKGSEDAFVNHLKAEFKALYEEDLRVLTTEVGDGVTVHQ